MALAAERHRTEQGIQTQNRVLDVAEGLFAERGLAATRLCDIAARAGLRTPSLYNHWASKEELYSAVLKRCLEPLIELLAQFLENKEEYPRERRIEEAMGWLSKRPNIARILHREAITGGTRLQEITKDWVHPFFEQAMRAIRSTPSSQGLDSDELPFLFLAFNNVFLGYFSMASMYSEALGMDLSSEAAIAKQTKFLKKLFNNPR